MGSQETSPGSAGCRITPRYGRLWPWRTTSTRSRSCPNQFPECQTSAEFPDIRCIAAASPPPPTWRPSSPRSVAPSTPRTGRSSGSICARSRVSTSMENGPAKSGGTGIKQLRENIAESKLSYEIMDDAAQVFLKSKIMDNIHKYFYMIAFTGYMREAAETAMSAASEEEKLKNALTGGKISTPADQLKLTKT